jgi:serine/threonine protein kinase
LETPHHVVLVLELMEGGDLFNFLYNRQEIAAAEGNLHSAFDYALPEDEARHVFTQVLRYVVLYTRRIKNLFLCLLMLADNKRSRLCP